MLKCANIWPVLCLVTLSACSTASKPAPAPVAPLIYTGVPAALLARCVVQDVEIKTTGDIVVSRNRWKAGFEKCAAQVDAIRKHDAEARRVVEQIGTRG